MICGFQSRFPKPILEGIKTTTMRMDMHKRWKIGMTMHMATGVRTPQYFCFAKAQVESVKEVSIIYRDSLDVIIRDVPYGCPLVLNKSEILTFIKQEGFESECDMMDWIRANHGKHKTSFDARLIRWGEVFPQPKRVQLELPFYSPQMQLL